MSGIYIRGMEMPTSCWLCHFQDCGNCVLNNHKVVDNCILEDRRDDDCPLIPVPDHGRLIDADAKQKNTGRSLTMAIAKEITVDVKVNISDDTICRCMRLLEMWMDDNPNDRVIVERKDTTTGFRHIIHIERGGQISTQSNG